MSTKKTSKLKTINIETIRLKVKTLRVEAKLKQKEMAEIMGMMVQNFNNFERGRNEQKPTLQQLYNLMQYFNVPFEYFLGSTIEKISNDDIDKVVMENKHLTDKLANKDELISQYKDSLDQCKKINVLLESKGAKNRL
jgi:transcriptional regulator with XRE-family HTH domain